MSRVYRLFIVLLAAATGAACQGTTAPEQREISGSWVSRSFSEASIRMTLTETARSVEGAGSWIATNAGEAFRVTGAVEEDELALLFDFDGQADLTFQGFFSDDDVLEGFLTGAGLQRVSLTFDREDLFVE